MSEAIDAHQHFWELGRFAYPWLKGPQLAPIRRSFLPVDLEAHLRAAQVKRTIVVQAEHDIEETRWALGLARRFDFIAGVVGWLDLTSERCEAELLELRKDARLVGIRHLVHDEPDDDFIVRDDVIRGLKVLEKHAVPFDLLFYPRHLRHVPQLARKLPALALVIDHLAKPRIRDGQWDDWLRDFAAAAAFPNVSCKLSGMVTEAHWDRWKPDDLKPYVRAALDAFGPQRCMVGSDWPVCLLAGSYTRVMEAVKEVLEQLDRGDREKVFGGTAAAFYRLST